MSRYGRCGPDTVCEASLHPSGSCRPQRDPRLHRREFAAGRAAGSGPPRPEAPQQPKDLSAAQPQHRRRIARGQPARLNISQNADPPQFFVAHHHQAHRSAPSNSQREAPEMTSLTCWPVTFSFCSYTPKSRKMVLRKITPLQSERGRGRGLKNLERTYVDHAS
jgi:hypothetical protein